MQISAREKPDDVKQVKKVVRDLLDINEELLSDVEHTSLDDLKQQLRERGPVLVW